ncbi:MAG: TIGR03960 family B12-binding radical SAM protein [Actinobacteria bacterium]|nr:TIGR03960 family B12-binding radical SAM protein [Actinomycetota bacterium]
MSSSELASRAAPRSIWSDLEPLLPRVRKPAQYVGGEHNQVLKDWPGEAGTTWVLSYPDAYEVGQPNQGLQILYELLNERPGTVAERAYAPWTDLEELLRDRGLPAFTLEHHHPVGAFDVVAFTLPTEVVYTNLLSLLDLAGIPLHAAERTDADPVVVVGGHVAYNPEPLAPFVDVVVLGEGEEVTLEIDDALLEWKLDGRVGGRRALLKRLATTIQGVYVPAFYEPRYLPDGRLRATVPVESGVPYRVAKRTVQDLERFPYPKNQIVPMTEVVHERFSVEIFRGCTRGCRFCQAGMITRPVRERAPETIKRMVDEGIRSSGYEEVGLLSLSSADMFGIGDLAKDLADAYEGTATSLSLPSTRVDAFNVELADELSRNGRRSGLTFAPEAGTERMRLVINKMVSEEDLLRSAEAAYASGWRHLKLYFMVGLPTETDEDVLGIADLGVKVIEIAHRHGGGNQATISVGGFVPKPHTPFQWAAQDPPDEIDRKFDLIRERIRGHKGLRFRWNDAEEGVIEGLLARGDRRLADVVLRAWELGARFDGWHEMDTLPTWQRAMGEVGVDEDHERRERGETDVFPWDHLDAGLDKEWLWSDWRASTSVTAADVEDCRWTPCYDCGVCPSLGLDIVSGHLDQPLLPVTASGPDGEPRAEARS